MLKNNYRELLRQIEGACQRAGRSPGEVKIIGITKRFSPEDIRPALELGIKDLGENRVQEALDKIPQLPDDITWHFVGHLQTNKARDVIKNFSLIHSLDRLSLARELQRLASRENRIIRALVQVNVSGEETKHGLSAVELKDFLHEIRSLEGLKVDGLMTMAPFTEDPEEVRPVFRRLRELRNNINIPGIQLRELSMGMTGDYTVAVEEGATMVRIGTALFGTRD